MGAFIFLAFGGALLATMFMGSNDDDSGEDLVPEGGDLEGTDGDDTLTMDDTETTPDMRGSLLDLGAGDDLSDGTGTGLFGAVHGGDGNDTITGPDSWVGPGQPNGITDGIYGDAGDDEITAVWETNVYGGDGNDTINYELPYGAADGSTAVDGGDGDDLIRIDVTANDWTNAVPAANFTGGEGADEFEVNLTAPALPFPVAGVPEPGESYEAGTGIRMADFTPGEDTFLVTISPEDGTNFLLAKTTTHSITTSDGELRYFSDLTLSFSATATTPAYQTSIRFYDLQDLSMDDIRILVA
jgi:hypothetical protein